MAEREVSGRRARRSRSYASAQPSEEPRAVPGHTRLREQLNAERQARANAEAAAAQLEENHRILKQQATDSAQRASQLTVELARVRAQEQQRTQELAIAQEGERQARAAAASAQTRAETAEHRARDFEAELNRVTSELSAATEKFQDSSDEADVLRGQVAQLVAVQDFRQGERSALEHAQQRLDDANKRAAELYTRTTQLEKLLQEEEERTALLERERDASASKSTVLTADLSQSIRNLEERERIAQERTEQVAGLEASLADVRSELAAARRSLTTEKERSAAQRRIMVLLGIGFACAVIALVLLVVL